MKNDKPCFKAVILAGGSGERFWPLSTPERPKQFLRVFGGESLIRQSVSRLGKLVAPEDVFVVTTKNLVAATRRELPEIPRGNIIGEPMRRDTGAAVALGVALASGPGLGSSRVNVGSSSLRTTNPTLTNSTPTLIDPTKTPIDPTKTLNDPTKTLIDPNLTLNDPIIGFFSSDQMVANAKAFQKTVAKAVALARRKAAIVTIGIRPDCPATGFGYISPKTRTFVEKPDEDTAKKYVKAGYLWNAGMFIARASTFRDAFAAHAPALECLANIGNGARPCSSAKLARIYKDLAKISFDYAVMEHAKNVEVVPGDFGWDDVGSFAAFDKYFPHDSRGNVREGPCTVVESGSNICVARSARISLLGVNNLVVVTTPNFVLVAEKSRLTEMKKLFAAM